MTRWRFPWRTSCTAWLLAVSPGLAAEPAVGAEDARPAAESPPADSLDQRLLESLETDLLEGLPELPGSPPQAPEDAAGGGADREGGLSQTAGEDLGQGSEDPLESIGRRMRRAEQLLAQRDTAEPTQRLQEEILDDLRRLIDQLQQQCQGGQSRNPQAASGKPARKPGRANPKGGGENRGANKPSRESTERIGAAEQDRGEWERMQRALKQVWGHLPEQVRQQVQSGMTEEFLPKYERLIGQYYLRLAEEPE